ncbi:MAG: hypothetical protein QXH91_08450 [Candidatus Bathyarchaeia archaeon]
MNEKLTQEEFKQTMVEKVVELLEFLGVEVDESWIKNLRKKDFEEVLPLYFQVLALELLWELVREIRH